MTLTGSQYDHVGFLIALFVGNAAYRGFIEVGLSSQVSQLDPILPHLFAQLDHLLPGVVKDGFGICALLLSHVQPIGQAFQVWPPAAIVFTVHHVMAGTSATRAVGEGLGGYHGDEADGADDQRHRQ
jgi:hypothetical protein